MDSIRYTPPSRLDAAPYGFIVEVKGDNEESSLWIQLNKDETTHPSWKPISTFLEYIFKDSLKEPDTVIFFLQVYDGLKKLPSLK